MDWQTLFFQVNRLTSKAKKPNRSSCHAMIKKWSDQDLIEDARRFESRSEWQTGSASKYQTALQRGILDVCCEHMSPVRQPKGTWDEASIIKSAQPYNSKTEWRQHFPGAYLKARKLGILQKCTAHMSGGKLHGHWSKQRCFEEARKYKFIHEFRDKCPGAYAAAIKFGWWAEIKPHFSAAIREIHWNKKACMNDALLYDRRSEWAKSSEGAYRSALRNGWLDDCCKHMDSSYIELARYIYAIYNHKSFYVGLSFDPERRYSQHARTFESSAYELIQEIHCFEVLGGPYPEDVSGEKEEFFLKEFAESGRTMLNKASSGSLGAREILWTQEACIADALQYQTRSEWRSAEGSGYDTASRKGWLEICCAHMNQRYNVWTDEDLVLEARKHQSKRDWRHSSPASYDIAVRRPKALFAKATAHMPEHVNVKWTAEACLVEAKKYQSRKEWRDHQASSVAAAKRLGIYDQCVAHMGNKKNGR